MLDIKEKFKNLTENNERLINYFKGNKNFTDIMVAGAMLGGIELRNSQRENNNLEGEIESSPFSSEMTQLIDKYFDLQKELENIEQNYEMEIN